MKKLFPSAAALFLSACSLTQTSVTPSAIPAPTVSPTLTPSIPVPSLVWLPFEHSSRSHDGNVIAVQAGRGAFEPAPVDIGVFWDYTPMTGRLAYASQPKHPDSEAGNAAVSDLWVYDYRTKKTERWADGVVHARWSSVLASGTSLQYLAAVFGRSRLELLTGPNQVTVLSQEASANFSWSPDGQSIAYLKDGGLFIVSVPEGETRSLPNVSPSEGWIGDKPVWTSEPPALVYSAAPVEIAMLDGSKVFMPKTPDGQLPESERALTILWSPEKRRLVFEVEQLNDFVVWIYELSPDLETIVNSASFHREESYPLADWWAPGESLLLRTGEIWSISMMAVVGTLNSP